jgi:putative ABC transport system permease protein
MTLAGISWKNLRRKPLDTGLSILLLAFGTGIISMLLLLEKQLKEQFDRNIRDIDLVLGAKGSGLQIILSSVYQVDAPTGNISKSAADEIMRHPYIAEGIPLSYGDNYDKYRIVGSTPKYIEHYNAKLASGKLWEKSFDAVLGAKVARESGLSAGAGFFSSHGLDKDGEEHSDHQFIVTGILEPCGCVLDQLVITSLESVWLVHGKAEEEKQENSIPDTSARPETNKKFIGMAAMKGSMKAPVESGEKREYTAVLLKKKNPLAIIALPNMLRETNMQVALPSIEINRLNENFGIGLDTLRAIALIITTLSFISLFISLFNSLKERKYELALMRSMGATRFTIFRLLMQEGIFLSALGTLFGLLLSRAGLLLLSESIEKNFNYTLNDIALLPSEYLLIIFTIFTGALASFLPAFKAVRMDISKVLSDE